MQTDILNLPYESQLYSHKLKRLVPSPNSYFMDVRCGGCTATTVIFSHAQNVISCDSCNNILAKPTGGKCVLTAGAAFKVKPV